MGTNLEDKGLQVILIQARCQVTSLTVTQKYPSADGFFKIKINSLVGIVKRRSYV